MKTNMGISDRIIRFIVALIIVVLYTTNTISGTVGIILLIVAGIFVLTSFVSFCPLYKLFGFDTCPTKSND